MTHSVEISSSPKIGLEPLLERLRDSGFNAFCDYTDIKCQNLKKTIELFAQRCARLPQEPANGYLQNTSFHRSSFNQYCESKHAFYQTELLSCKQKEGCQWTIQSLYTKDTPISLELGASQIPEPLRPNSIRTGSYGTAAISAAAGLFFAYQAYKAIGELENPKDAKRAHTDENATSVMQKPSAWKVMAYTAASTASFAFAFISAR